MSKKERDIQMTKLEPDRSQIADFVKAVFRHAGSSGFISIRSFNPDNTVFKKGAVDLAEGLDTVVEVAFHSARAAAQHAHPVVFCPPLAVFSNRYRARAEDLLRGLVLSAECDQYPLEARRRLEELLGPCAIVVASGGEWTNPVTGEVEPKLHLHWRLSHPTVTIEDHARLYDARRQLILLVGSDPTNAPVGHPIRWPGSWHRKSTPRPAKIVASSEHEIDLNDAVTKLCALVGELTSQHQPSDLIAYNPEEVTAILDYIPNLGDVGMHLPDYDRCRGYHHFNRVGLATFAASGGCEAGRQAYHAWASKCNRYNYANTERRWRSYLRSPPNRIGHGTLHYLAWEHYVSTLDPMPDHLRELIEADLGKGVSFDPSDNRFGRITR